MTEPICEHVGFGAVARRVGVSLVVACVVPAALFYTCFRIDGVGLAMASALAWAYGAMAVRAATGRRVSGMLVITATVLTVRTVVAVAADSAFLYFVQPAISDAVLGVAFVVSLLVGRPLSARLAGDFYPITDHLAARDGMRTLFRRLTACWSAYLLAKAVLIVWLLTHLDIPGFVQTMSMVNPVLNLSAAAATIAMSTAALRRERLVVLPAVLPGVVEIEPLVVPV